MRALVLASCLIAPSLAACGDDNNAPADAENTLYHRLGEASGIRTVIEDFVARVGADAKINGYFLNSSVDLDHVTDCLVLQVGNATGGPEAYPTSTCRSMEAAHTGLGISTIDFDDLLAHLVDALEDAGVSVADRGAITAVLEPMAEDIVEDVDNNATVYQRVGRKPAISFVVTNFEARTGDDPRVNGFFGFSNFTRLHACLTRQVCDIDGPCKYGEEVAAEFGDLTNQFPCRDMTPSHFGLMDNAAIPSPITIDDFNAIAENLITELDAAGVTPGDRDAIITAIAPLCSQIVFQGTGCP